MIKVFHGDDRSKIAAEVRKILGENYEVFDGESLKIEDIVNIFKGTSLFATKRKILIKDLTEKRKAVGAKEADTSKANIKKSDDEKTASLGNDFYEEIAKYADTEHDVIIWETVLSQKKPYKDFVKENKIEVKKFEARKPVDAGRVFGIFDLAMQDGERAVKQLEEIEEGQDPYMFFGLMASQAIKRFEWRNGRKEKAILKELAKLDIKLKSTTMEPWILIKSFLIRMPKI